MKYDNVIDKQRKVVYGERDNVLNGVDLKETILQMARIVIDENVAKYIDTKPRNYFKFYRTMYNQFMPEGTLLIPDANALTSKEFADTVYSIAERVLDMKAMLIGEQEVARQREEVLLEVVDNYWVDHIDLMDQMRQSVGLVSVAQKDPVKEYTMEAYHMFNELNRKIMLETLKFVISFDNEED